jgi:CRP-like cAMP-binding protein
MAASTASPARVLSDGTLVQNHLLLALPLTDYERVARLLRTEQIQQGQRLHEAGAPISTVYFPNGGVYSVTAAMRDGTLVEVATVGREGMLGVSVFLGDPQGAGETLMQVPNGPVIAMTVDAFLAETGRAGGVLRDIAARYAQAFLLQSMQSTACNALHQVQQRCCRWLLQTHDRVGSDEFLLKHEFLAIMLGVQRPTVTIVIGTLQEAGLIRSKYGRIHVLDRQRLEEASCECYSVIREHFTRLRLASNGA